MYTKILFPQKREWKPINHVRGIMFDCVGLKLGNYRLVRLVGRGGFADVYLGEHIYLRTEAAIKVLHSRLPGKLLQQFLAEACNHARLHHPNIIPVLDFGIENTISFLIMHYAPHGTLRQRYPTGSKLDPSTIVSYVKQITLPLQYAHAHKIIHRDIKPENILLNDEDAIMLSDFGIAIALRTPHNTSMPALFSLGTLTAGTTTYMAPEQFSGTPCYASDQYALATLVYEWFCGTPPFTGSDLQVAVKHMYREPPFMREILPTLDPAIERVIMRALAKNPQQRFASVQHFSDALEAVCKPISSRLYPSAKVLVPATHAVSRSNPSLRSIHASTPEIMNQRTYFPLLDRPPLFSKTISEPLKPEQATLMSFLPTSPVQSQSLVLKAPTALISVPIKQAENRPVPIRKKKNLLLLAIIIFCLSSIITLFLISFIQPGSQPTKKQVPIVATTGPKKMRAGVTPLTHITRTPSSTTKHSPRPKTLPVARPTQIAIPQPTLPSSTIIPTTQPIVPTPRTITPTPQPIPPTPQPPPSQTFAATPSTLNRSNCIHDNAAYRCTVTLILNSSYTSQLSWQAYGIGINAFFNLKHGVLSPGQSQQIIVYVFSKCSGGSLVFSGANTSVSLPWSC